MSDFTTYAQVVFVMNENDAVVSHGTEEVDPETLPKGSRAYRVAFTAPPPPKKGPPKPPALLIARSYNFARKGEVQKGYTTKLGMVSPALWAILAKVVPRVLAAGQAKHAAAA